MPSPRDGQQLLVAEALRVCAFCDTNHIMSTEKEYSVLMTPGDSVYFTRHHLFFVQSADPDL